MSFADRVSIIIPTLNRSQFLIKKLRYLRDTGFGGYVLIGDSSNDSHLNNAMKGIAELELPYQVFHQPFPGLKALECTRQLAPMVSTPYAMWMPDDDFEVPETMEDCTRFLDENLDYSAAGGLGIALTIDDNNLDRIIGSWRYGLNSVEAGSASQRLIDLLANYSVVSHSISRTEQFRKRYSPQADQEIADETIGNELLPASLLAAQGKIKMLDRLFVVRQIHPQRYLLPDALDWISKNDWLPSYQSMCDLLADEIARQDGVGHEHGRDSIKRAFWSYLMLALNKQWAKQYSENGPRGRSRLIKFAKRIPFLQSTWHWGRVFLPGKPNQITLRALLRPSCPYHKDFMPVYEAVISPVSANGLPE